MRALVVREPVLRQVDLAREDLLADGASEGEVLPVDDFVLCQLVFVGEAFGAVGTGVRAVDGVDLFLVRVQRTYE